MRVETNERLIKRNKQIATYLFIGSMAILIGGFFIANGELLGVEPEEFNPSIYFLAMSGILFIGMTSTISSIRMTNLWVRLPRPETAIREGLKGLSSKSVLYNYHHIPARHVLICPQGVFAIITRFQNGKYVVAGDQWKTRRSTFGWFFSIFRWDSIGNPTYDAVRAAAYVEKYLKSIAPDVTVQPLIVFVDVRAQLEITKPVVPVLFADSKREPSLKEYLKDIPKDSRITLTLEQIEAFDEATL